MILLRQENFFMHRDFDVVRVNIIYRLIRGIVFVARSMNLSAFSFIPAILMWDG